MLSPLLGTVKETGSTKTLDWYNLIHVSWVLRVECLFATWIPPLVQVFMASAQMGRGVYVVNSGFCGLLPVLSGAVSGIGF